MLDRQNHPQQKIQQNYNLPSTNNQSQLLLEQYTYQIQDLKQQLLAERTKNHEADGKSSKYICEIERLNRALYDQLQQIEILKSKDQSIEIKKLRDVLELRNREIDSLESQIDQLKDKINDQQMQLEKSQNEKQEADKNQNLQNQIQELKIKLEEKEEKLYLTTQDLEVKKGECNNFTRTVQHLENQLYLSQSENERLQGILQSLQDENLSLKKQKTNYMIEIEKFNIENQQLKQLNQHLTNEIQQAKQEAYSLTNLTKTLNQTVANLQEQYNQAQYQIQQTQVNIDSIIANNNSVLQLEIQNWKSQFQELNKQYHQKNERIRLLEVEIQSLTRHSSTNKENRKVISHQKPLAVFNNNL